MSKIVHVTPHEMLLHSFMLGKKLYDTGFRPKHAISIWRGGTTVGLGVEAAGPARWRRSIRTTIATEPYTGVGQQGEVVCKVLELVIQAICREDGLLLIDDVYETGQTIGAIIETLRRQARANFPEKIMVGTIHRKPDNIVYQAADVQCLFDMPGDTWIDYPHELVDLVTDDPQDPLIREKSEDIWKLLRADGFPPVEESIDGDYRYIQPDDLLLDSMKLGVNVFNDGDYFPNFIVALWPGGVAAGLPLHEAYKYKLKTTGQDRPMPDHISLNTASTHLTYQTNVLGLDYLADRINRDDNVLLVDCTFKGGRFVNDAIIRLKEVLRRNFNEGRVRVASVYWNPDDQSTWTVQPTIRQPHYYVKKVDRTVVYPHAIHRLNDLGRELATLNSDLHKVVSS